MQATVSAQAMEWVLDHSPSTGTDRLVLLAIARHADRAGCGAYPSAQTIAAEAAVHRVTAFRSIERLTSSGAIEVEHGGGRHRPNTYRIVMEERSHTATVSTPPNSSGSATDSARETVAETVALGTETVAREARNGSAGGVETVALALPEPTTNQLQPKPNPPYPPVEQVFAAWQASTGKRRAKLDAKRRRIIDRALKDYPLDDVLAAVDGWRYSPHHRGENRDGTVYDDLGLLLRDAAHIEKFRDLAIDGPPATGPRLSKGQDAITRVFGAERSDHGFGPVPQLPSGNAGELAARADR